MAKFLLVYYGGKTETDPKKAKELMDAWTKWLQSVGKAVVDAGHQTTPGKIVSKTGVTDIGANAVGGYSIFQAENLDAAIKLAKGAPLVPRGGTVAVYNIVEMM